jgi:recombinational DNA repair ATPase RecF
MANEIQKSYEKIVQIRKERLAKAEESYQMTGAISEDEIAELKIEVEEAKIKLAEHLESLRR